MKFIKSALLCFLLLFVTLFSAQEAKACHAIALVNITPQTPVAGGIIVNASSDSPTCGCAVYWLDVEVRCIGEPFNGAAFSPGFYGPLNTYPFYQSAQMNKPSCVVQPYGGVTIMFAPLCPGTTYQYRMRENHNFSVGPWCATQTFVVPGIMPTFTATVVASANNICSGSCSTLTATPTGGCQIAVLYNWSTGATTSAITVCPAVTTTYTCAVTDDCSNQVANLSMTIVVLPAPIAGTASVSPGAVCSGTPVNLTLTGSAGTIQWQSAPTAGGPWTNIAGATTATFTTAGMVANTCFQAVVSGCGAPVTSNSVCITINPAPTVNVNSPTICPGATANLTATGATSYVWTAGATVTGVATADATPVATTTYTVTGTTAGCTGSAVATVTVNPGAPVVVNSPTICAGQTANLTATGATSYVWTAGTTVTGVNTADASPIITTTYTVTGTTGGCTSSAIATVTVNPLPVTTVNSPSICPTFTANLVAGGATTYAWTAGVTVTGVNTGDATPVATTTYTVTGTSLGCTSTAIATVTVNSGLAISAGADDTVCFAASAILGATAGAGFNYSWTPAASLVGAATATPTATPATTTTYTVLVTDAGGCTGTSSVTVYADPQITLAIAGIDVTCNGACNGQTIVIPAGGTPAYSYSWTSGCTAASCTSLCPGTYTVTVTDSWGCTASGNATVIEPTLLTASVTATTPTSCNGVCDGTATAAGAGGTVGAGYSYSWNTVPAQATATATGLCAGTYTCTITDANGCTATTTATITEPTVVVIAPIAPATVCTGGSTVITASASGGNGGAYAYTWTPPAGLDFTNIASPTSTPAATTVYTVNATDVNGCPAAPVNVTVTVNPGLTVAASGTASICPGASANISALAALGNGGPYTYTWLPAGTPSGSPVSVSPAATTTYTVTASDGCSPTATATVTITVLPLPVVAISASATSGCEPLCLTLINNSTVAGGTIATWMWDYGDGSAPDTAHAHCYANAGQYSVGLTVTSNSGCTSTLTNTNMITVHPTPVASFTAPAQTSIINPTIPYTDMSTVPTGSIATWSWNFGDPFSSTTDSTSSLQNPTHTFTEAGTYCAKLTVTSNFGCIDSTQLCIIIDPEFTFFIPNAFSPNGDGINDEFYGKGDYIKKFEMYVYDRWGNAIFYADDINKHWDGKANHGSDMAQEDVYVYLVKITDHKDKKHKYTGTVTIVK